MSAKEGVPFYHLNAIPPTPIPNRPCNNCEYFFRKYRTSGVCCNSIVACVDWSGLKAKGGRKAVRNEV